MKTKSWALLITLACVSFFSNLKAQTSVPVGKVVNVPVTANGSSTFHAILNLPDDYSTTSGSYPLLIFCHGVGEAGTDLSTEYNSTNAGGVSYFLEHNLFPTSFTGPTDGKTYKFIVLCPQAPTFSTSGQQLDYMIKYMIANYRVDTTRLYLTALSAGGAGIFDYTTHNGFTPSRNPTAIVPMSMDIGVPQQSMENQVKTDNVHVWGFGSETDILGINTHLFVTGAYGGNGGSLVGLGTLGRFTSYTGGHCCWNQFYDPTYKETINGKQMNIYEWMLQFAKPVNGTTTPPPAVTPPTANAGADQTLILPVSMLTLDASGSKAATGHTISSYSWKETSGPAGAVLLSTGSASTSVTALAQGTYVFTVTVTDDQGKTASDDVQVTINAATTTQPVTTPPATTPPTTTTGSGSGAPGSPVAAGGKNIVKVGTGEYFTSFLTDENKIYATLWNNTAYASQFIAFPLSNIVDVDGAQYTNICRSSTGAVYVIGKAQAGGGPSVTNYSTDVFGRPFTGNTKAYGWFQSYLTIRNDSIYYFGLDNLAVNGGAAITAPIPLIQPPGKKVAKITVMDISPDIKALIMVMCTDGTVWQYNRGSKTPVQIALPAPAVDITSIGRAAYIVATASDLLAWGPYTSYVGLADGVTKPTSILSKWTGVGAKFPFKQLVGSWNDLHIIDGNDHMFACGDNMQGEIGNGIQYNNWKGYTYNGAPAAFAWSWLKGQLMQSPVQIPGNFTNLCGGNSIAFYYYVQDQCQSNWYSWGRNKQYALANGHRMSNDDVYADWGCVPAPTLVRPSTVKWIPDAIFNPNAIQAPYANAGIGQCINTSTVNLSAALSFQQAGTITSYKWTMVSGTGGTITTPNSAKTTVTGLTSGLYAFQVAVTNSAGMTSTDIVYITVTVAPNKAPVANGGSDQTITLPINSVTLTGSGTDADGTIASFFWTKLSGPAQFAIVSSDKAQTAVNNLTAGVYTFQLVVTDNQGASSTATVKVTVNAAPIVPGPPSAVAGADQIITLPTNSVSLAGSGSETNGTITGYKWTQLTGPTTASIGTSGQAATTVSALVQGVYVFQLTVTDKLGVTATDAVKVTVNPAPIVPGTPIAVAGADQIIVLPANSVSLAGSGSETNGTITGYKWTQLGGPTTASIGTSGQAATTVSGLVQGVYTFQLTVTDNSGVTAIDAVKVTVNPAVVVPGTPVVDAGANQVITLPINSASLNATASETNGTIKTYNWIQLSGPATSTITTAGQAATTVSGLAQGVYTYQITVTDNSGVTATDVVKVTVNAAVVVPGTPVVEAGANQVITLPTNSASLNATASETNGTIKTYKWIQLSGPATSTIATAGQAATTVSGLAQGVYTYQITVTDNSGVTATDVVKVTVNAAPVVAGPPAANAGGDKSVTLPTNTVTLTGIGSETNGTITSYAWAQVSGPAKATIAAPDQAQISVTGLAEGTYVFKLTVTDNAGVTATDQVTVTVKPEPTGPLSASAGTDQVIALPTSSTTLYGGGAETNGTITGYKWVQLSGPSTSTITTSTQASTTVTGMVQGVYNFQLTVTDKAGATATATVQVTVNAAAAPPPPANKPPVANAGGDKTIAEGINLKLDGSASYDPDGTIVQYSWLQLSGKGGVTISNANSATPTLYGLTQGTFVFQLTVTDNQGAKATDKATIQVTAAVTPPPATPTPQLPIANAGKDTTVTYPGGNSALLNGSASYATAGQLVSYVWRQLSGPTTAPMSNASSVLDLVSGLAVGDYSFVLTVTDGNNQSASDTVVVHVKNFQRDPHGSYQFSLYPNPVLSGQNITIHGTRNVTGKMWFNVIDLKGRVIKEIQLDNQSMDFQQVIGTTGLSRGMYVVVITLATGQKAAVLPFVVN